MTLRLAMACKHGVILVEITHVCRPQNLDLNALPADVWEVVLAIGEQNAVLTAQPG